MNEKVAEKDPKVITIIVNAREVDVEGKELSYEQIVEYAYPNQPLGSQMEQTVTYSKGEDGKKGEMRPGEVVKIKKGMIFSVSRTNQS